MTTDHTILERLHERLEMVRQRIFTDLTALTESKEVPAQLIHELADIDGAIRAVTDEITRHKPSLGYGAEN